VIIVSVAAAGYDVKSKDEIWPCETVEIRWYRGCISKGLTPALSKKEGELMSTLSRR
jgi:hypothetical protein